jgi:hypothetical protein
MRGAVVVAGLIIASLVGAGAGYLASSATISASASTWTTTSIQTETETTSVTTTMAPIPESQFIYLTSNGYCTAGASSEPCFGNPAYLFNACSNLLAGPAAQYTCPYTVSSSTQQNSSYTINITLGVSGRSSEPGWANCSWATAAEGEYAACVPVINSTAFIMGEPSPSPP